MPKRERMYRGEEIVTVIQHTGLPKSNPVVKIRNSRGFPEEVRANDLKPIPAGDPASRFEYKDE